MDEHAALYGKYRSGESGLSPAEAVRRLEEFGPNTLQRSEKKNYLAVYLRQYTQFFAVLLEVAAALSFVADYYAPGKGSDILAVAIACAVVVNATFSFWQEYKADKAMEALLKLMPTLVSVLRDGKTHRIDSKELVPGDVMLLEEGDKIAADAVLTEATSLYVNMAALNGESNPSRRFPEAESSQRVLERRGMVFAGTTVVSGSGRGVVSATAQATEFGKIASLTKNVLKRLTPMQKEIIRITRILTLIAVAMGIVFFLLGLFSDKGVLLASIFALSLIVANVPEGMLPTITLALSMASQRMARRNALIKNLDSVQTLGSVTVICTDKTGTLTRNEMTLKEAWLSGGETAVLEGEGYFEKGEITLEPSDPSALERLEGLLRAGMMNSRATIEGTNLKGDPTELAIVAAGMKAGLELSGVEKIGEIPFTAERKMMSTRVREGGKQLLYAKGAVEVILQRCSTYLDTDGARRKIDAAALERFDARSRAFEMRAYRVLAVAGGEGEAEEDLTFLGLVAIMDLPRPEVKEALQRCKRAGIRTMMITGDNPRTAEAVAAQIGLEYGRVLSGDELESMGDEALQELLEASDVLFARMASNQKLKITTALQNNGEVVAMTGDGVNDAPSLKKADIGIAMGRSGTEVAKEAADMILLDDRFSSIVSAVEEGRTVYFNIKKFVTYILSSNVPEIVPYVLQFFLKIPLPLSVIQILSIDLGSDMLPGLALGSEKPEANIMKRPPVGQREKILDWEVFKRGYFFIGIIEAAAAMSAFIGFLLMHGWTYGTVDLGDELLQRQAMTMTLLGAISCQLLNVWTMRSWEFSAWSVGLLSNPLLLVAMVIEWAWIWMLLAFEPAQKVFNTAPVPPQELWILLPFPLLLFVSHEVYKWRLRSAVGTKKGEALTQR
jgi:sodium/potassium-transporting ATPase subunit alpha